MNRITAVPELAATANGSTPEAVTQIIAAPADDAAQPAKKRRRRRRPAADTSPLDYGSMTRAQLRAAEGRLWKTWDDVNDNKLPKLQAKLTKQQDKVAAAIKGRDDEIAKRNAKIAELEDAAADYERQIATLERELATLESQSDEIDAEVESRRRS